MWRFSNQPCRDQHNGRDHQPQRMQQQQCPTAVHESSIGQSTGFFASDAGIGHVAEERLGGFMADGDDGRGHNLDAVTMPSNANTKVQCGVGRVECGIESADSVPCLTADQHSRLAHGEDVADAVVLGLVQLVFGQVHRDSGAGHGFTKLAYEGGTFGIHLFGAHRTDRGAGVDYGTEVRQRGSRGDGVVAQDPHEAAVIPLEDCGNSVAQSTADGNGGVADGDISLTTGCVRDHDGVRCDGLRAKALEYFTKPLTRTSGDDDRGDGDGERPAGHGKLLRATAETTAFALGKPAPDAESFVVFQGVFQAFALDRARAADALGVTGRSTLFGEEGFGIGLRAESVCLPGQGVVVADDTVGNARDTQSDGVNKPVLRNVVTVLSHWRSPVELVGRTVLITPVLFGFVKSNFGSRVADVRENEHRLDLRKIIELSGAR